MELEAVTILETLENAGFEAFFVGGCVRDKVLGRLIKDIDIATSAKPEDVIRLFAKTLPTGLQHGTVTVMLGSRPYEVTTFRKESGYTDYRRPAEVEFISDLHEDLRRRDFTMNAMAMDRSGLVIDPFGGREDIRKGILRCVGEARERFEEDALRMMRCVRFASTYRLKVEGATWDAVLANRLLLRHVAMERVRTELERMMDGADPLVGWRLLAEGGLLACTKQAFALPWNDWQAHSLPGLLQALPVLKEPLLRWMVVFRSLGIDADGVREAMGAYTFSVKETEAVARYVGLDRLLAERYAAEGAALWKSAAIQFGRDAAEHWIAVSEALPAAERHGLSADSAQAWLQAIPAFHVKELAATGKAIIDALGKPAGPWVSRLQQQLLFAVALGEIRNQREELLTQARIMEGAADT